ncbi:SIR2 family protein [Oerskovia sp. M15]
MHGDVDRPATIVLSRSSFVRYDTRWKPVGSLVQSLMMTKHLLVVGASMTDDNLLRFAYEVAGLREELVAAVRPAGRGARSGPSSTWPTTRPSAASGRAASRSSWPHRPCPTTSLPPARPPPAGRRKPRPRAAVGPPGA